MAKSTPKMAQKFEVKKIEEFVASSPIASGYILAMRYCSADEMDKIINGESASLGTNVENFGVENTHEYIAGERYLHLFTDLQNADGMVDAAKLNKAITYGKQMRADREPLESSSDPDARRHSQDNYEIGLFYIPQSVAVKYAGKGSYGGDISYTKSSNEVAVPASKFDCSWLQMSVPDVSLAVDIAKDDNQVSTLEDVLLVHPSPVLEEYAQFLNDQDMKASKSNLTPEQLETINGIVDMIRQAHGDPSQTQEVLEFYKEFESDEFCDTLRSNFDDDFEQ